MGLGRHRTAIHGVSSKRAQMPAGIEKRLNKLEARLAKVETVLKRAG